MLDYIVIGGGSAGCVLASRLSEDPQVQVALLEAGSSDKNALIHLPFGAALMATTRQSNWCFKTTPQPGLNGRCGYQPRGKVLGGSSSINVMIYTRGHRADYDHWQQEGNPGWSYREVLPYFKRAQRHVDGPSLYHGGEGPLHVTSLNSPQQISALFVKAAKQAGFPLNNDFNGPTQDGVGLYQVTQHNGERWSAAKAYITPHLGRPNLHVITHAQVSRILLERKRAVGVEYHQGGEVKQLRCAREVLLCAGAIQSPQILMLSGIGPRAHLTEQGIATLHELSGVGQHLHDHVDALLVTNAPQLSDTLALTLPGITNIAKGYMRWRKTRSGLMTTNLAEAGGFIKSQAHEALPDLQLHFVIGRILDHGRKPTLKHGYSCHVCVLRPASRGSVRLASKNPYDAPLIDPNFLGVTDDVLRLIRGVKQVRSIMSQPALAQLGGKESPQSSAAHTDMELEQFVRDHADTVYHPVGSCRMGPGELDVVDAQLRVHGLQGLRVVDASIMPRIVGANTNAPVIMIAENAADMILGKSLPPQEI